MTGRKRLLICVGAVILLIPGFLFLHRALTKRGRKQSDLTRERIKWPDLTRLNPGKPPFSPGEKLVYEFGWNGLECARFTLRIDKAKEHPDQFVFSYEGRTTNAFVEKLWSYRVNGKTWLNRKTLLPARGRRTSSEKGDEEDIYTVEFDRKRKIVKTALHEREDDERSVERLQFVHGLDLPGAFLMARSLRIKSGEKLVLEVVHKDEIYAAEFVPKQKQRVSVKAGDYEATEVELRLHALAGSEEERSEEEGKYRSIRLWFAEERGLPVKLLSKVYVGEIYGELVSVDP
ncbi:MAG: DUF3108 domain-containing protein [Planctomycetes bacterium]|nr:DUF3108 domain-containing protein [Planctomycetota bacterium]